MRTDAFRVRFAIGLTIGPRAIGELKKSNRSQNEGSFRYAICVRCLETRRQGRDAVSEGAIRQIWPDRRWLAATDSLLAYIHGNGLREPMPAPL